MAHWAKDPTLVQGMFYAFIFQDALHFEICGEDVVADLAEAIEHYRWAEFEARLDVHHASLIQHREAKDPDSNVRIAPSLAQGEPRSLSIVALHSLSFSILHHA